MTDSVISKFSGFRFAACLNQDYLAGVFAGIYFFFERQFSRTLVKSCDGYLVYPKVDQFRIEGRAIASAVTSLFETNLSLERWPSG